MIDLEGEDAQELLILLLQRLHGEINDATTKEYVDMDEIVTENRSDEVSLRYNIHTYIIHTYRKARYF